MVLGDLTEACQHPRGRYQEDRDSLFTGVHSRRMRHNSHNLKQGRIQCDVRKFFSTVTVSHWNGLQRGWSQGWPCFELEVKLETSQHSLQSEHAHGSVIPGCSSPLSVNWRMSFAALPYSVVVLLLQTAFLSKCSLNRMLFIVLGQVQSNPALRGAIPSPWRMLAHCERGQAPQHPPPRVSKRWGSCTDQFECWY